MSADINIPGGHFHTQAVGLKRSLIHLLNVTNVYLQIRRLSDFVRPQAISLHMITVCAYSKGQACVLRRPSEILTSILTKASTTSAMLLVIIIYIEGPVLGGKRCYIICCI